MSIRAPHPAESARIAELVKASFSPELHPYMAMTQHGASEFFRAHLQTPESSPERMPYVWTDSDTVLAFADFRMDTPGSGFLSYICVDERATGQGIATALISRFIREHLPSSLQLDVFRSNATALALYTKFGFQFASDSRWLTRAIPREESSIGSLQLRNLHVSHACFAQYGFCELETARAGQPIRVGRIGTGKLRVPNLDVFRDDAFLASARKSFPSLDEALYIDSSSDSVDGQGIQVLLKSVRLTLQIPSEPESDGQR